MRLYRVSAEIGPEQTATETIEAPNPDVAVKTFRSRYRWCGTPNIREITPAILEQERMVKQNAGVNSVRKQLHAVETQLLVLNQKKQALSEELERMVGSPKVQLNEEIPDNSPNLQNDQG